MGKKMNNHNVLARLWQYQAERSPMVGVIVMAALTVGVFASFASFSLRNYLISVIIVILYLIQNRLSDEKKDFEHDNKFHKDRPVQRGLVSLQELLVANRISIISQIVLYVSFLDLKIFALGLASQGYAYLAKKEFFVRDWIRQHFFTYYFLHYLQWIIFNLAILAIIQPLDVAYWKLIVFVILNIAIIIRAGLIRNTITASIVPIIVNTAREMPLTPVIWAKGLIISRVAAIIQPR